jgi:hypothetical protein
MLGKIPTPYLAPLLKYIGKTGHSVQTGRADNDDNDNNNNNQYNEEKSPPLTHYRTPLIHTLPLTAST